ncbi:MAG: hypothetical protein ACI8WB_000889 [Phenylobacterium sp.]|jgi:hypothetical protein
MITTVVVEMLTSATSLGHQNPSGNFLVKNNQLEYLGSVMGLWFCSGACRWHRDLNVGWACFFHPHGRGGRRCAGAQQRLPTRYLPVNRQPKSYNGITLNPPVAGLADKRRGHAWAKKTAHPTSFHSKFEDKPINLFALFFA